MGSELADFERALLFDEDKRHWGWCRWPGGGGDRVFTLSKSRFLGEVGIPVFYVLPEGFESPPSEGQFIQVEADGQPRQGGDLKDRFVTTSVRTFRTVSDREADRHPAATAAVHRRVPPPGDHQLRQRPPGQPGSRAAVAARQQPDQRGGQRRPDHPAPVVPGAGWRRVRFGGAQRDRAPVQVRRAGGIPSGFREVNPEYIYRVVTPSAEKGVASLMKKVREVNLMTDPGGRRENRHAAESICSRATGSASR